MNTLTGGRELDVAKLDGSRETVFVRQLPVRLFQSYMATMQDEAKQVELLCSKEAGWADGITLASHEEILQAGNKLNSDFFSRWLERQKERAAMLPKPDVGEAVKILEALQRSNPALVESMIRQAATSNSSSPTSPLPPG